MVEALAKIPGKAEAIGTISDWSPNKPGKVTHLICNICNIRDGETLVKSRPKVIMIAAQKWQVTYKADDRIWRPWNAVYEDADQDDLGSLKVKLSVKFEK